jgi:hypothetical protein
VVSVNRRWVQRVGGVLVLAVLAVVLQPSFSDIIPFLPGDTMLEGGPPA